MLIVTLVTNRSHVMFSIIHFCWLGVVHLEALELLSTECGSKVGVSISLTTSVAMYNDITDDK